MRIRIIYLLAIWIRVAVPQNTVPMFLLDNKLLANVTSGAHQALHRTEKTDFERILDAADNLASTLVFFVEEHFCLEDVSQKDHKGTALPNLRRSLSAKRTKFFLNVHEPYELVEEKFHPTKDNVFTLRSPDSPIKLNRTQFNKYIIVLFDDIEHNEPRMEILRRHDTMVTEVMQELSEVLRGPIVGFYFGKFNPMVFQFTQRTDRDIKNVESNDNNGTTRIKESHDFYINCGRAQIRMGNPVFINEDGSEYNAVVKTCKAVDCDSTWDLWGLALNIQTHQRYKIFFQSPPDSKTTKVWSVLFKLHTWQDSLKESHVQWPIKIYALYPYWKWEDDIEYYNQSDVLLAKHRPKEYFKDWTYHNHWSMRVRTFLDPGKRTPPEPKLQIDWIRIRMYPAWLRECSKPGEEFVSIEHIVRQWPVYPPDLFVTPAIIMAYIVGVVWFGMLALALKMLASIKTNDRFDPPGFQGVLHQEVNEYDEL